MHFARSEEQAELAAVVGSLLERRSDSAAVRAAVTMPAGYDEALWEALCQQVGVAALPVPEQYDGAGAGLVESAVVLEELGRNLAPVPLLATTLAAAALVLHADEPARAELLPRLASGEVGTLVLDELVLDAAQATIHLRVHDDRLEIVESPEVTAVGCLDQTVRLGRVCGVGRSIGGLASDRPLRDVAIALCSALQVGATQRGLEMTVAYSLEREQFGRPIGSFQALKHRMADMLVLVEASRSASWGATSAAAAYLTDPTPVHAETLARRAAVAGSYCSEALEHVASETVQLHGGIAITWEHDAQLVLKRAHVLNRLFGQAHEHRARLG